MNKEQVMSVLRSVFKVAGAALTAHGMTKAAAFINGEDVIGILTTIAGLIMSHYALTDDKLVVKGDAAAQKVGATVGLGSTLGMFLALAILTALLVTPSMAQTNMPAPAATNSITSDLKKLFEDDVAFFGTNQTVTIDIGGLYSDKKFGGLLDVHTPLPLGTNGQVSAGISAVYLDGEFYSATLNLKAGTTVKVPVIGDVFMWAESGPGVNMHSGQIISQTFAGGTKGWDIYKGFWLYVSGFAGNISDRAGTAYGGAISSTFKF